MQKSIRGKLLVITKTVKNEFYKLCRYYNIPAPLIYPALFNGLFDLNLIDINIQTINIFHKLNPNNDEKFTQTDNQ